MRSLHSCQFTSRGDFASVIYIFFLIKFASAVLNSNYKQVTPSYSLFCFMETKVLSNFEAREDIQLVIMEVRERIQKLVKTV